MIDKINDYNSEVSYDDGKALRVILMGINLCIMIGFYWSTMKL